MNIDQIIAEVLRLDACRRSSLLRMGGPAALMDAAPVLAAEVQRLRACMAEVEAERDEAIKVANAASAAMLGAEKERDELRLTLAAERGDQAGAPSERWRWSQRLSAWVLPFRPESIPEAYRRSWQDTDEDHDPEVKVYRIANGQWVARWFRGRPHTFYPTAREALLDVQILADRHE